MNAFYSVIKKNVECFGGTFLELSDLYDFIELESKNLRLLATTPGGYQNFAQAVLDLIADGILIAVNPKIKSNGYPSLPLKYRKKKVTLNQDDIKREIRKLALPLNIEYYLSKPNEFIADKDKILIIENFFKKSKAPLASINERSYELFQDEKYLRGRKGEVGSGQRILKNLGLTYSDLNCYITYEPFFYIIKSNLLNKLHRNILIVENMDTFWSVESALSQTKRDVFDIVIYGEGKKIFSSFKFTESLGLNNDDTYLYFGDIDHEGINILSELSKAYQEYSIEPMVPLYELMLRHANLSILKPSKEGQRFNEENFCRFLAFFTERSVKTITEIIGKGLYVPQEILSLPLLIHYFSEANT